MGLDKGGVDLREEMGGGGEELGGEEEGELQ